MEKMFKKLILFSFLFLLPFFALADIAEVKTDSGSFVSKVAPGEFLPVTVKLLNFGGGQRVDVQIHYRVFDKNDKEVLTENETVAVETTASFVKVLQLPHDLKPGRYKVASEIFYQDQMVPATASFEFTVARKFAGLFLNQLVFLGGFFLIIIVILFYLLFFFKKRGKEGRFAMHDYSEVSKDERIFYEILSDIITQMRLRVGGRALELAGGIEGLIVDEDSGRVTSVSKNPAKIIALLVLRYEQELGEKISFGLRDTSEETKEKTKPVDKNLLIVRKYFE